MKKLLTIFLLIALQAGSTNYYISTAGSDGAAGTSTGSAWATIAKVNSFMASFNPGDSILFRRGDTWTGSTILMGRAGAVGNNIIISAYGTGAKPIITRDNNPVVTVTAASRGYWTLDNLDLRTVGAASGVGASQSLAVYFNYWPSEMGAVPGWEVKNCDLNGQMLVSGPDMWIHHNLFDGTANAATNVGGAIVIRADQGKRVIIEYNEVRDWTDRGIWIFQGVDTFYVRHNFIHNIAIGGDQNGAGINSDGAGAANPHGKIYGNTIDTVGYGISLERAFYNEIYNNSIDHASQIGITMFTYSPNLSDAHNISIHHNLIKNTPLGIVNFNTSTVSIKNNTIYQGVGSSNAFNVQFNSGDNANHITFTNNIIAGTWTHPIQISSDVANLWDQFDYNDIVPTGSEVMFVVAGSVSRNLATLQGLGYMTNGTTSNPSFVTAGSNFALQTGSPAINTGTTTTATSDILGNPIVGTPDMGAYEYQTVVVTNPNYFIHKGKRRKYL